MLGQKRVGINLSFPKFDKHRKKWLSSKFSTEQSSFSQWKKFSRTENLHFEKQLNRNIAVVPSGTDGQNAFILLLNSLIIPQIWPYTRISLWWCILRLLGSLYYRQNWWINTERKESRCEQHVCMTHLGSERKTYRFSVLAFFDGRTTFSVESLRSPNLSNMHPLFCVEKHLNVAGFLPYSTKHLSKFT